MLRYLHRRIYRLDDLSMMMTTTALAVFRQNLNPPNLKRLIQSRTVNQEAHHHNFLYLQRSSQALNRPPVRIEHRQALMEAAPFLSPPNPNRRVFRSTQHQLLYRDKTQNRESVPLQQPSMVVSSRHLLLLPEVDEPVRRTRVEEARVGRRRA